MPRTSARLIRMPREKAVRARRGKPEWHVNRLRSPVGPRALPTPAQSGGLVITGSAGERSSGPAGRERALAGTPVSTGAGAAGAGTRRRDGGAERGCPAVACQPCHVPPGAMEAQSTSWNADRHSHIPPGGLTGCRLWPAPAQQLAARAIGAIPLSVCRRCRGGGSDATPSGVVTRTARLRPGSWRKAPVRPRPGCPCCPQVSVSPIRHSGRCVAPSRRGPGAAEPR